MPRTDPAAAPWRVVAAHITSNVRTLRDKAGWTQADTAERANIDAKHMQAIEAGSGNVTVRTLVALAVAFGVDPRQLLDPAPASMRRPRGRPRQARDAAPDPSDPVRAARAATPSKRTRPIIVELATAAPPAKRRGR